MEFAGRRLNRFGALQCAAEFAGFADHGLTCLAITSCSPEQSVVLFSLLLVFGPVGQP